MRSEVSALPIPKTFTQTATGSFAARVRPGTPHCGPTTHTYPTKLQFTYVIELKYHGNALDANGFLVDNTWFAQYFAPYEDSQISISCENLARLIARDCLKVLGNRACQCECVTVSIGAVPGVMVSATCEAGSISE